MAVKVLCAGRGGGLAALAVAVHGCPWRFGAGV